MLASPGKVLNIINIDTYSRYGGHRHVRLTLKPVHAHELHTTEY